MKGFRGISGEIPFSEVFLCAKRSLILPNANADVEQIFSAMNYVKSKFRNSLKTDFLNAVLVIKSEIIRMGMYCISYELTDSVVKGLGTLQAYKLHRDFMFNC